MELNLLFSPKNMMKHENVQMSSKAFQKVTITQ